MAGNRAFTCASRPIDRYDEVARWIPSGRLFRTHPRFLVPGLEPFLERLLKNRLAVLVERPAAVKAGRLFPAGLAVLRDEADFGFAVPARFVHDD